MISHLSGTFSGDSMTSSLFVNREKLRDTCVRRRYGKPTEKLRKTRAAAARDFPRALGKSTFGFSWAPVESVASFLASTPAATAVRKTRGNPGENAFHQKQLVQLGGKQLPLAIHRQQLADLLKLHLLWKTESRKKHFLLKTERAKLTISYSPLQMFCLCLLLFLLLQWIPFDLFL